MTLTDSKNTPLDEIKRTSGPQTTNGRRWEVQLSAIPPGEWRESSAKAVPRRVEFDRTSAYFKSEEDHVKWIASTNARCLMIPDQPRRERLGRVDAEMREKEGFGV